MFETMYNIGLGSRGGLMNRSFTIVMLIAMVAQCWRVIHFHFRLVGWRYRLRLLEQEAREEGVVTVTDPEALPPSNPYMRFWEMAPSLAIMLGLLGTFIGLTLSLSEIPVSWEMDAIRKGLSQAIPSMGTAFWTSLCGLVIAICVRVANAMMASEFRSKVMQALMMSEPQVIEALEATAFQQGRDGALLRPLGIRELLWHQNRLLNQTVARVAPQVSEGIARGLGKINDLPSGGADNSLFQQLENVTRELSRWQEEQRRIVEQDRAQLNEMIDQQKHMVRVFTQEMAGFQTQLKQLNATLTGQHRAFTPQETANPGGSAPRSVTQDMTRAELQVPQTDGWEPKK